MAVGDVVNDTGGIAANITFQPAASVECMISWAATNVNWVIQLTDGTDATDSTTGSGEALNFNMKLFINNTNYLTILGTAGAKSGYSGIQIK